jgi:hypothetical protein
VKLKIVKSNKNSKPGMLAGLRGPLQQHLADY